MNNPFYQYLRIATTEAGLATGNFHVRGLPEPATIILVDHSVKQPQSTGGMARHGYHHASVIWERLTGTQANAIRALIETAEATYGQGNGTLWLTLPRTTGEESGLDLVDISGKAHMPDLQPATVGLYTGVTLTINNVTVENEPSTVL